VKITFHVIPTFEHVSRGTAKNNIPVPIITELCNLTYFSDDTFKNNNVVKRHKKYEKKFNMITKKLSLQYFIPI